MVWWNTGKDHNTTEKKKKLHCITLKKNVEKLNKYELRWWLKLLRLYIQALYVKRAMEMIFRQ